MEVDSYTNSHEAQLLITKGEQQYWTSQQPLSPSNFVHDYDHRFNLPVNAPSGTWEVKQVKLISNDGTYIYSKDLLISKGYQTSVNLTNPVADEVNPELISIQNLAVSGIDSNPNTNIVVSIQASVSDAQNDFSRAAGGLKSPNYDGGGGVVSDWALLDLQTSPFTADFAWVLDPKTASGNYTIDSLRFYDTAGNRTTHRGTSSDLDNYGDYVITINNPIEDTHTPELSDFSLSGYIDNDSRKILKIETNINNGEPGNTELRRQYVRIQSPDIGNYDTDNFVSQPLGSFENVAYIKLPRGAPDGMYSVDFFFVVDNALNDNKLTNQELVNTFGEGKTKVVFGTSENCPAITSSPNFSANENQTAIGNVTVATNCTSNSFQLSGQDQASISIDSSGVLTFNTAPDYETKSSYTVDLTVTDTVSNETASQTLLITINNLNDNNPVITSSNTFTINENETNVGTIVATDADGDPISFALSGVDAGYFSLGAASGVLSFLTAADYEEQASYSIVVTASDGENSVDQTITVSLNDVNDTCPTITSPSTYSADENQTVIGNITVDSACTNIIFEIAGTDQNLLTVNNLTGALAFVNAPDFESKNQFSAIAKATDGNNNVSQKAIAISVNNLNDNFPVITSSNSRNMDEGETAVITVNATDADDSSDPGFTNFSYTINGVDANFFSIDGAGNIVFSSSSDFETQSNYSITVNVSDGLNITSQAISVSLNDLNDEVPVFTSASSWTIDENNTIVGSVTAIDQDANSTLSYSISGGDDAGAFILNANNGTLEFATAPDYETKTSYNLEVTVSDGANTASQNITVAVNNLDDNDPIFTSPSTINVNENESFIGTLTATDADGETITFAPTEAALIIDEITGDISWSPSILSNDNLSNYEWYQRNNAGLPYSFQVYAYSGQSTVTMILTINVLNVNEAPERLSGGVKDWGCIKKRQ